MLFKRRNNLYSVITTFKHREESDLEAKQARQAQNIKNQNKNKKLVLVGVVELFWTGLVCLWLIHVLTLLLTLFY